MATKKEAPPIWLGEKEWAGGRFPHSTSLWLGDEAGHGHLWNDCQKGGWQLHPSFSGLTLTTPNYARRHVALYQGVPVSGRSFIYPITPLFPFQTMDDRYSGCWWLLTFRKKKKKVVSWNLVIMNNGFMGNSRWKVGFSCFPHPQSSHLNDLTEWKITFLITFGQNME